MRRRLPLNYAHKKSISLPRDLYDAAQARAARLGYKNFSEYLQNLVRIDLAKGGAHVRPEMPTTSELNERS